MRPRHECLNSRLELGVTDLEGAGPGKNIPFKRGKQAENVVGTILVSSG